MGDVARATAVGPRVLVRALAVCFLAALWVLLSQVAADAGPRDDAGGPGLSEVAHDAVGSSRDAVDRSRQVAEPVGQKVRDAKREAEASVARTVGHVDEAGGRVTEEAARTVEGVARDARQAVDDTTAEAQDVVQQTTQQAAEVIEQVPEPVVPSPGPRPQSSEDADRVETERHAATDSVHESLVAQEDPALLVVPATPALTLSEAAAQVVSSAVVESLSGPVPAPSPKAGHAPDVTPPAHSGTGQPVPTSAHTAYLGDVVPATDLDLVQRVLERALVPPAERATSPGTTPD